MARHTTPARLLAALAVAAVLCIGGMGAVSAQNWSEPINTSDGEVDVSDRGAEFTADANWTNGSDIMVTNEIHDPVDYAINFSLLEGNISYINTSGDEVTSELNTGNPMEMVAINVTDEDLVETDLSGTLWQTYEWDDEDIREHLRTSFNATSVHDNATQITEENISIRINQTVHENSSTAAINSSYVEVYDGPDSGGLFTLAGDNAKVAFIGLIAVIGGLVMAARKEVI